MLCRSFFFRFLCWFCTYFIWDNCWNAGTISSEKSTAQIYQMICEKGCWPLRGSEAKCLSLWHLNIPSNFESFRTGDGKQCLHFNRLQNINSTVCQHVFRQIPYCSKLYRSHCESRWHVVQTNDVQGIKMCPACVPTNLAMSVSGQSCTLIAISFASNLLEWGSVPNLEPLSVNYFENLFVQCMHKNYNTLANEFSSFHLNFLVKIDQHFLNDLSFNNMNDF